MFPEADNYRSVVGTVGRDVRELMQTEIPFKLHFNELGRHTLYIPQRGAKPLGLVHARSEPGVWGINEFVWAISPSLEILGVKVQRTRDSVLRSDGLGAAVEPLIGKDIHGLLELQKVGDLKGNASALLRSAIKTLFVTKHVWAEELREMTVFAVAARANVPVQKVHRVTTLYSDSVDSTLRSFDMALSPVLDRATVVGYQLFDAQADMIGLAVLTPLSILGSDPVWWVVDNLGEIQYVGNIGGINSDFSSAIGYAPSHPRDCSSAVDLAALEIATIARDH